MSTSTIIPGLTGVELDPGYKLPPNDGRDNVSTEVIIAGEKEYVPERLPMDKRLPQYDFDDGYYLIDFITQYRNLIYRANTREEALRIARNYMMPGLARVCRLVYRSTIVYYAKLDVDSPASEMTFDTNCRYNGIVFYTIHKDKDKDVWITHNIFGFLVNNESLISQVIDSIPFHREVIRINDNVAIIEPTTKNNFNLFNIFPGFKAKLLPIGNRTPDKYIKVTMKKCSILLNHIYTVWASGDVNHYRYILKWFMMSLIELRKTEVMLIIIGGQGCGKTIIFKFLENFVTGSGVATSITTLDDITGSFNVILSNKMFILIDEAANVGSDKGKDNPASEKMKNYITGDKFLINEKYKTPIVLTNNCSFALTSNNDQPMRISDDDRRHAIFKCSNEKVGDREYFKNLDDSFTDETANAFYSYLFMLYKMGEGIRDINILDIPDTEARRLAIEKSKPVGTCFFEELANGLIAINIIHILFLKEGPSITLENLYGSYKAWHSRTNNGIFWNESKFSGIAATIPNITVFKSKRFITNNIKYRTTVIMFHNYTEEMIKLSHEDRNVGLVEYIEISNKYDEGKKNNK